jgi:DNA repair exonuclease SbcCD ATPase subunit
MPYKIVKRQASQTWTPPRSTKRMRSRSNSREMTSYSVSSDDSCKRYFHAHLCQDDESLQYISSPTPGSPSQPDHYPTELVPLIERLEAHVKYLEEDRRRDRQELQKTTEKYEATLQAMRDKHHVEIEDMKSKHDEDLQRYRNRIQDLEDEVQYNNNILELRKEDVERLEEETDRQRHDIEELVGLRLQDDRARISLLFGMKDKIIDLIDDATS